MQSSPPTTRTLGAAGGERNRRPDLVTKRPKCCQDRTRGRRAEEIRRPGLQNQAMNMHPRRNRKRKRKPEVRCKLKSSTHEKNEHLTSSRGLPVTSLKVLAHHHFPLPVIVLVARSPWDITFHWRGRPGSSPKTDSRQCWRTTRAAQCPSSYAPISTLDRSHSRSVRRYKDAHARRHSYLLKMRMPLWRCDIAEL